MPKKSAASSSSKSKKTTASASAASNSTETLNAPGTVYPWKNCNKDLKKFLTYRRISSYIHSVGGVRYGRYDDSLLNGWKNSIQGIKLFEHCHEVWETDALNPDVHAALNEFVNPGLRLLPHQVTCMQWLGDKVGWKSSKQLLDSYGKWAETILPTSDVSARLFPDNITDGSFTLSHEIQEHADVESAFKVRLSCVPHGYFGKDGRMPKLAFGTPTMYEYVGRFIRDYTPGRVTSFAAGTLSNEGDKEASKTEEAASDDSDSDEDQDHRRQDTENGGLFDTEFCIPVYLCSIPTGLGKTMIGLSYACLKAFLRNQQLSEKKMNTGTFHTGTSPVYEEDFILPQAMLSVPGKDAMTEETWQSYFTKSSTDFSDIFKTHPESRPWTDCCLRGGVMVVAPAGGIQSTWEVTLKQWFPKLRLSKFHKETPKTMAELRSILRADVVLTDKATFTSLLQPNSVSSSATDLRWIRLPEEYLSSAFPKVKNVGVTVRGSHRYLQPKTVQVTVAVHRLYEKFITKEQLEHILRENARLNNLELVEENKEGDGNILTLQIKDENRELDASFVLQKLGLREQGEIDTRRLDEQLAFSGSLLHAVSWSGIVVDEAHKWSEEKLRLLKSLRADDIILLTASMTMLKFSAVWPVSSTLLGLAERLRDHGDIDNHINGKSVVSSYHIFHLEKDQTYNDTQRTFFDAPVLSQNKPSRKSASVPKQVSSAQYSSDSTERVQGCKIRCTWTIVPLENNDSLQGFYKKVTQFLANLAAEEQTAETNKKWDPRGHSGKLLRLMYTAIITGTVNQQSTKYVDDLLKPSIPKADSIGYKGNPAGAFSTLWNALDINASTISEASANNGVVSRESLVVYPHWNSNTDSPMAKPSQGVCLECKKIMQKTLTNIESENVGEALQSSCLTFNRETFQFERVTVPDTNNALTDEELRELNSFKPTKMGLFSGMCGDNELVLPLNQNKSVASIYREMSWDEATQKHEWLQKQKPEHLVCILCSDTTPAEIDDIVTNEDDAWIIQPL